MSISVGGSGIVTATFNNPIQAGSKVVSGSDNTAIATVPGDVPFNPGDVTVSFNATGQGSGQCNITVTVTNPDSQVATGSAVQVVTPAQNPDITAVTVKTT